VRALLDTSVFVAKEQGRPITAAPEEAAVSVMTIAELHIGVLAAADPDIRAARLRTLAEVERTFEPLPVDAKVARRFAEIVVDAKRGGRRVGVIDALIAATGAANDLPVFTQDSDFEGLVGVQVILV